MSEHSPISGNDATDNFLISLRDDFPKGSGKPFTGIGATNYMDLAPDAPAYNLNDSIHPDQWLHRLRATNDNILVFVHGYGDGANKALERHKNVKANLMAFSPEFTLVTLDWPAGNAYKTDKDNATKIAPKLLSDCLQPLINEFDAKNIHLLAHSMGAYVTETAFQLSSDIKINHVLVAAADVDREHYMNGSDYLTKILGKCADLTAYWGMQDEALQESARINPYIPLGLRGYRDGDLAPQKQSLQCADYYNLYVKAQKPSDLLESIWSHVWYLVFLPATPPPSANDCFADMMEIIQGKPTAPTRTHLLRPREALPAISEPLSASEPPNPAVIS
jgi:pimeloyl-ACP methyl ester carboxylesterase